MEDRIGVTKDRENGGHDEGAVAPSGAVDWSEACHLAHVLQGALDAGVAHVGFSVVIGLQSSRASRVPALGATTRGPGDGRLPTRG
jgi:hypothetical protein